MQTITQEYTLLFNALTDTETTLRLLSQRLVAIQQQAEELFLERDDPSPDLQLHPGCRCGTMEPT